MHSHNSVYIAMQHTLVTTHHTDVLHHSINQVHKSDANENSFSWLQSMTFPTALRRCVCYVMQGAKTSGRIPREATLKLSLSLSTALSSESVTTELFKDASDAAAGALDLAGTAACAATEQYQSAVRLQSMTGQVRLFSQRSTLCCHDHTCSKC